MDWWDEVGAYAQFFGDSPALAADMANNGPNAELLGYSGAYALQSSALPITLYDDGGPQ